MQGSRLILITTLCLVGCASLNEGPFTTSKSNGTKLAPPEVTFELTANGLPEKGMWKSDPVFADVNKDGHLDLAAIVRLGNGTQVWFGDGKGNWTDASNGLKPAKPSCGGGVEFADLNDDGHLDLAVADHCAGVFVFLGDSKGNWNAVTKRLNPPDLIPEETSSDAVVDFYLGAEDLDVGDMNGDGNLDLLVASSDKGGINIYHGDGSGSNWERHVTSGLSTDEWANRVMAADMNNDGHLDVVAGYAPGPRVWLNNGEGYFVEGSDGMPSPVIKGLYHGVDVADVNNDGRMDVAIANWVDGPEVYLQQANGSWKKSPDIFPQLRGGAIGVALGDVDGDQNVDLVTTGRLTTDPGYVRGVYWLKGDGRGNWRYIENSGLPSTGLAKAPGVAMGDVNGDGLDDVAVCSGLNVETPPVGALTQSAIPQQVLVWCVNKSSLH